MATVYSEISKDKQGIERDVEAIQGQLEEEQAAGSAGKAGVNINQPASIK